MSRASATAASAATVRAVTTRVAGSWPRRWTSSVNDIEPSRSRSIGGRVTNVPRPRRPLEAALAGQVAEGAADGDQAAAVALGELALGGQPVAGAPFARLEGGAQVKIDLVVERDRARQEPEACHARRERPLAVGRGGGLRSGMLLLTL